eukprot:Pgem_evm1s8757
MVAPDTSLDIKVGKLLRALAASSEERGEPTIIRRGEGKEEGERILKNTKKIKREGKEKKKGREKRKEKRMKRKGETNDKRENIGIKDLEREGERENKEDRHKEILEKKRRRRERTHKCKEMNGFRKQKGNADERSRKGMRMKSRKHRIEQECTSTFVLTRRKERNSELQ